jgi:hypothetical protein
VGGAELIILPKREDEYLFYRPSRKGVEWKIFWFYVGNQPSLPEQTSGAPTPQAKECWTRPSRGGDQVQKLIEDIAKVKKVGVTGGSVVYSFMSCPVQPLQKRIHPVF